MNDLEVINLALEAGDLKLLETIFLAEKGAIDAYFTDHALEITPLIKATMLNSVELVKFLLSSGANPNLADRLLREPDRQFAWDKSTPLHIACRNGDLSIARLLAEFKAQINCHDDCGVTPLMCAVESGNVELVRFLLANQAEINARMNSGKNSIYYALHDSRIELLEFLLRSGGDIQQKMDGGWTPLLSALASEQYLVAQRLLYHGADRMAKTDAGWDMYHVAKDRAQLAAILNSLQSNTD